MCKSVKIARPILRHRRNFSCMLGTCGNKGDKEWGFESNKKSTAILADHFDTHGYRTYWQEYSLNVIIILVFCIWGSAVGNAKWQESRIIMYISILDDGVKFISHRVQNLTGFVTIFECVWTCTSHQMTKFDANSPSAALSYPVTQKLNWVSCLHVQNLGLRDESSSALPNFPQSLEGWWILTNIHLEHTNAGNHWIFVCKIRHSDVPNNLYN
jgi:hypothetical protein